MVVKAENIVLNLILRVTTVAESRWCIELSWSRDQVGMIPNRPRAKDRRNIRKYYFALEYRTVSVSQH